MAAEPSAESDVSLKDAARIWWILRFWGVEDMRLLNCGWQAWRSGDYRIQILGHENLNTTKRYVQRTEGQLAEVAERLSF
ncbi:MAG TPA: hypothetical protein VMR25_27740 [Planctomycetaceae bacterium]|nr:hypothetical protein [Planctomycetaceae bacterium]